MSRRNALIASRSDRPSRACSTITVATTSVGTDGWLRPRTTRSANSAGGNSSCRWSARKAYTDLSEIRWRHQIAASNWSSDGWLEGLTPGVCRPQAPSANYRIDTASRIGRTTPIQQAPRAPSAPSRSSRSFAMTESLAMTQRMIREGAQGELGEGARMADPRRMTPEEHGEAHALLVRAGTDPDWQAASQDLDDLMGALLVIRRLLEAEERLPRRQRRADSM